MSDRYLDFTHSPLGKQLAGMLGLPSPPRLQRATGGYELQPLARRVVLVGGGSKGLYSGAVVEALHAAGAELYVAPSHAGLAPIKAAASDLKVTLKGEPTGETFAPYALVFDASGIDSADALRELYEFMQPRVGRVARNGRVVLIGQAPDAAESVGAATAATALRGFTHSLGKEAGGKGITVNLIEVGKGAEGWLAGPLRFFLTEHSAFVSGQSLVLGNVPRGQASGPFVNSLAGKTALVTGAARGIGAAIAQTLAREGAQVIGMDRPQEEGALAETMSRIGGRGLALDVTAKDAPQRIATELGGLDIVVHNAGVTRDKMLRNMPPHWWDQVLNINLGAIMRINERLLEGGLNDGARMVCISSIGGIGGNAGQTNYGATKAGIIGYAEALAPVLAKRGGAINAVAPGFIETAMTAAMPAMPREVGRRLASLSQGGLPIDIAEAVTFFASPLAGGVNGRTLRVCGQNFMGA